MTQQEIIDAVGLCYFPGYTFDITFDATKAYISASYLDSFAIKMTRQWPLEVATTTKAIVVGTCFKCIQTSTDEKTRDWFTFCRKPIFDQHQDVDKLLSITEAR